eukprot:TRINITY_DN5144_c0_g1_i1.p1 TRINITY_DN5144_c0_g1~~TRINITY_DN5144_c0_g1_i1.p1  ORF type:complete len:360 (+),score=114.44 TRINITY_DN5144_c0_g1_i1:68-1147(+)
MPSKKKGKKSEAEATAEYAEPPAPVEVQACVAAEEEPVVPAPAPEEVQAPEPEVSVQAPEEVHVPEEVKAPEPQLSTQEDPDVAALRDMAPTKGATVDEKLSRVPVKCDQVRKSLGTQYTKAELRSGDDDFKNDGRGQKYEHLKSVAVKDNQVKSKLSEREQRSNDAEKNGTDAFAGDGRGQKYEHLARVEVRDKEVKSKLADRERRSNATSGADFFETNYSVKLTKATFGPLLGMDVKATEDGVCLRIDAVDEGGLVEEWNNNNTAQAMRAGDVVLEVNGISGSSAELLEELQKTQEVSMKLTRRYQEENLKTFTVKDEGMKAVLERQRKKAETEAKGGEECQDGKGEAEGESSCVCS